MAEKLDGFAGFDELCKEAGLTPGRCTDCGMPYPKEKMNQHGMCKRCDDLLDRRLAEWEETQVDQAILEDKEGGE